MVNCSGGRIGSADAVAYWVCQIVGGVLGMALARWVIHPAPPLRVASVTSAAGREGSIAESVHQTRRRYGT